MSSGGSSIYGDGSDGSLTISANTDWTSSPPTSTLQYSSVTVNSGTTLTVPTGLIIRVSGNVSIAGTIKVAANSGALQGIGTSLAGVDGTGSNVEPGGTGCGCALAARSMLYTGPVGGGVGPAYLGVNLVNPAAGGGTLVILASGSITIGGAIHADGVAGVTQNGNNTGGGGGGGGVLVIASKTSITNNGTITAQGGAGANYGNTYYSAGGGGGGGIVSVLSPSNTGSGTVNVSGGAAGTNGTVSPYNGSTGGFASGGGGSAGAGGSSAINGTNATAGGTGYSFTKTITDPSTLAAPAVLLH